MNTLKIENLSKTYKNGVKAIDNVSLELSNGMFGLLGPNGAGKSSLMRTIAGLQQPDSGTIILNQVQVTKDPGFMKQQLGYLPQEFGVYPKIPDYALLDHLAVLKGIGAVKERKEQVSVLLEKTNLYSYRNKPVATFSGGMRQRFGIAQALLGNPQVIIVDEPTAGLDPEERNRFNNLLSEIGEQIIVILSTHLVEDVHNLCTRMAIMQNGSLAAIGKPEVFVADLKDKIWSKHIAKEELPRYQAEYQMLSSHFHAGKLHIHVYAAEHPGAGFRPKLPDLQDVYFTQLRKG